MGIMDFLGFGNKTDKVKDFVEKGAVIIDVRTYEEFASGHIKGSKNIPLQIISSKVNDIKKWDKPVIVCCRSGMRSAQANSVLNNNGIESINGGGWESLEKRL